MPAFVWALAIVVILAVLLLQDMPSIGIGRVVGHNPELISTVVVVALIAITLLMSVDRLIQELF